MEKSAVDQKILVLRDFFASKSKSLKCKDAKSKLIRRGYQSSDPMIKELALECWQEFDVYYLIKELKTSNDRKLVTMACDLLLSEGFEDRDKHPDLAYAEEHYGGSLETSLEYIRQVRAWASEDSEDISVWQLTDRNDWRGLYPYTNGLQGLVRNVVYYSHNNAYILNLVASFYIFPHYNNLPNIPPIKRQIFLNYFPTPTSE